jgi:hypothetical protein
MNESRSHSESAICQRAHAPSNASTPRIGFENVHILKDIRLEQSHRRWNADSSSIPQAIQIGSSIRPMLCRCLFNGQCPVMSPTKILNLDLCSPSKYLVKPGLGFFTHILDWRQAVSKLHEAGIQGYGPTKAELDPALAITSVSSFLWIPTPVELC